MRFYSFYSDSHRIFKDDWFLPTFQDKGELKITHVAQRCEAGSYFADGWNATMLEKLELLLSAVAENWERVFVYADIDIQWFAPVEPRLETLMGSLDLLIQRDTPKGMACAGLFACRANARTKTLFENVLRKMKSNPKVDDQKFLNDELRTEAGLRTFLSQRGMNASSVRWRLLPSEFFSPGILRRERWTPGTPLPVPENVLAHHANWTVGIENKIEQLRLVRDAVQSRRNDTSSRFGETAKMR